MAEMAIPTDWVDAVLSARATTLGLYPTESITAWTALAVAGATRRVPLTTWDTVETETPARRATSVIVATHPPRLFLPRPARKRAYPGRCFYQFIHDRNDCAT